MTHLVSVTVGGTPDAWRSIGIHGHGESLNLGGVEIRFRVGENGVRSWHLLVSEDSPVTAGEVMIDGIATTITKGDAASSANSAIGDQTVVGVDHVVINTDDLDRTCAAIEGALGEVVRRERDAGHGVEQRFFKFSNTIVEVVGGPHVGGAGASLWGFVISVDDLFDLAESLGPEVVSAPKRATQPGRFISTVRSSVGLGVPFAMMTPHVRGMATR